jgi:uncharacterized protein (DUF58 family)
MQSDAAFGVAGARLTPAEARLLDGLMVAGSGVSPAATSHGTRLARARGTGLEFHDFRPYQQGDDPRAIEWTIHARLRQLVVRTFRSETHLRIHVLLDTSASMGVGRPDKLAIGRRIAAALCYLAVRQRDAVGVATFDETIRTHVGAGTGRQQLHRLFETLDRGIGSGASDISRALTDYGALVQGPGLVVVISDFLQPGAGLDGLRALLHRGLFPAVVQVVAPEEIEPDVAGETELVDIEDPAAPPLVVEPDDVAGYQARFARFSAQIGEYCMVHGLPWMRLESSGSFGDLLEACLRAGLLASRG